MTDKQINKWLRRRFSQVGWVLIGYYCLMNLLVMLEVLVDELRWMLEGFLDPNGAADFFPENAWGYIATLFTGLLILHAWKGPDYWRGEVLVRESNMRPGVLACLLCFSVGAQMVNSVWVMGLETVLNLFGLSAMAVLETVSGASDTFSMFLYASVLGPISEEILFRGYVLRSLRPFGKRFAILGSAVLFGLFHGNLLQAPYAFMLGLLLGYVTVEYSIGWAVLIHVFNNLVLADLLTRLTAGWSDMAYSALNLVLLGGCFLLSLGILIRKRSAVREYRSGEWMDRRCLKCLFLNPGVLCLSVIALVNMVMLLFI